MRITQPNLNSKSEGIYKDVIMEEDNNLNAWRDHLKKVAHQATLPGGKERRDDQVLQVNYRWEHVQVVVRLGFELARLTGADVDVVEAAAWLHDVRKKGKNDHHGVEGAKAAQEILKATDFPKDKIDQVSDAISKHVGLYKDNIIEPLEAAILWDADKLAKLGATSVLHSFLYWISKGNSTIDQLIERQAVFEWQEKTVQSFNTEPALQAGRERLASQKAYWSQLLQELDGSDLKIMD
jgi:uncharacterized protein